MVEHGPGTPVALGHDEGPIVLFDGVCHLCSGIVQFVLPRDPRRRLRFAPLQSAVARRLLDDLSDVPLPDSFVLIESGKVYVRSAAALRLLRKLAMPWPLLTALWVIPRPLRDWAYDFVARRRYGWFGTRASCFVPTPDTRDRFLDGS